MRLWSLHPEYLDAKGLVALWREALLARHVLEGKTRGYRAHPQLARFRTAIDPLASINTYLLPVYEEASKRGYSFDAAKVVMTAKSEKITVTTGQMSYETGHLLRKLEIRDKERYSRLRLLNSLRPHPLFHVVEGDIEQWEITGARR